MSSQVGPENCLDSQIDWSSLDLASRSCAAENRCSRRMTARRVRLARQSLSLWPRAATGRMVAGRLAFTQARKESMIWSSVKSPHWIWTRAISSAGWLWESRRNAGGMEEWIEGLVDGGEP